MDFFGLEETIAQEGLEALGRYYAVYEGIVADRKDPEKVGRLQLKIPSIFDDQVHEYWAKPRGMVLGSVTGFSAIPEVGDKVWVSFESGNVRFPIWEYGTIKSGNNLISDIYDNTGEPTKVLLKTKAGHTIIIENGSTTADSRILIQNVNGATINLSDVLNIITLGTDKINIGSSTALQPAVLGTANHNLWVAVLAALNSLTVVVTGASGVISPASQLAFDNIKNTLLDLIKSDKIFLER